MKNTIPVFVIAFPELRRREAIVRRLAPLGIKPRFVDAVDGKSLAPEVAAPFRDARRAYHFSEPLRDGAIGCALAHYAAWRKIIDDDIAGAIILEDDARPTADAAGMFAASVGMLIAVMPDVVFLSRRHDRPLIRVTDGEPSLAVQKYSDMGTESYFISRRAAEYLTRMEGRYLYESHQILQHWWLHGGALTPLYMVPSLFEEDGTPSQIGYDARLRHPHDHPGYAFVRRVRRVYHSAIKRLLFPAHVSRARRKLRRDKKMV